ncbi:hypothetical protein, partial [Cypionkella sp.]|uniref:DUF6932 family protein n=1 Tax=Cypionkella sp. TaxID=2811411 RepID=UPI0026071287
EDHQAIFGPGRHHLDLDTIRELLVSPFKSTRRFDLYSALFALSKELNTCNVRCELWLDGSFITQKPEPDDIDLSIMVDANEFDILEENGKALLEKIQFSDEKYLGCLDSYLCIIYPKGDPRRKDDPPEDWAKQWSLEHNERYLKGFGVMRFGS